MIVDSRYWDADAFLGWLKAEEDKVEECGAVLAEAEAGRTLIVTSALTLAEVIKLKRKPRIPKEDAERIREFFANSYICVRNVDRYVAEDARELLWEHQALRPKDAIHVATALRLHVPRLETFDEGLQRLSGQIGEPRLTIERPAVVQRTLPLAENDTQGAGGEEEAT